MAIAKNAPEPALTSAEMGEVAEIERMLDEAIRKNPNNVNAWKKEWLEKPPGLAVITRLRAIYEDPAMGWKLETQPDRDGLIIWLK
jgi:hypothetical protein